MVKMLKYKLFFPLLAILVSGCSSKGRLVLTNTVNSKSPLGFWNELSPLQSGPLKCTTKLNVPLRYRLVHADSSKWNSVLKLSKTLTDTVQIELPGLDGAFHQASVARSGSVPVEWEHKFGIWAFAGQIVDMGGYLVRMESDSLGMRIMYSGNGQAIFLNKVCNESPSLYILFDQRDLPEGSKSIFE